MKMIDSLKNKNKYIIAAGTKYPICITKRNSDESPVWVWGNMELAKKICKMMNKEIYV